MFALAIVAGSMEDGVSQQPAAMLSEAHSIGGIFGESQPWREEPREQRDLRFETIGGKRRVNAGDGSHRDAYISSRDVEHRRIAAPISRRVAGTFKLKRDPHSIAVGRDGLGRGFGDLRRRHVARHRRWRGG